MLLILTVTTVVNPRFPKRFGYRVVSMLSLSMLLYYYWMYIERDRIRKTKNFNVVSSVVGWGEGYIFEKQLRRPVERKETQLHWNVYYMFKRTYVYISHYNILHCTGANHWSPHRIIDRATGIHSHRLSRLGT